MASATVPNCDLALLAAALDEPDSDLGAVFKALSVRNQAIGVLIDQGNVSDEAVIELSRRANKEGVTMDQAAQVILDTLTVPGSRLVMNTTTPLQAAPAVADRDCDR